MNISGTIISMVPTMQWCRELTCPYSWTIPSYHVISEFRELTAEEWAKRMLDQWAQHPWKHKKQMALWRGSATGESILWRTHNQRVRMARIARDYSAIVDVRFVGYADIPQVDRTSFTTEFPLANMVERSEQQNYMAIIDIDGNRWSSRLSNQMCLNSVTIRVETNYASYYNSELHPWVHYVPVYGNLTNLVEMVEYVVDLQNAEQMQQIVRNANKWCASRMTGTRLSLDLLWILTAYNEALDRHDPDWRQLWKANETAYLLPHIGMSPVRSKKGMNE